MNGSKRTNREWRVLRMRMAGASGAFALEILVAGGLLAWPQVPGQSGAGPAPSSIPPAASVRTPFAASVPAETAAAAGGMLHGFVKSGNVPLPGVTVTAQNTLTGKRYSTSTDIRGAWSLGIPQNGRYVVRTQFAAFAQGDQEALLNDASHD